MRIRCVGGPNHNRLIDFRDPARPIFEVAGQTVGEYFTIEHYELKRFVTAHGTKYLQYIHESLMAKNGRPSACTYKERFKKWKLNLEVR